MSPNVALDAENPEDNPTRALVDEIALVVDINDREPCIPQFVPPAERIQKYLSSHEMDDPYTAACATLR